jgi:hypothetical protein
MGFFKRFLILFFTGFILGPIGDYSHVVTGTTAYPQGKFAYYILSLPFWVPFLFGGATAAIGLALPFWDKVLGPSQERRGARNYFLAILGLILFLGFYILSGALPFRTGGGTDLVLAALAILLWLVFDGTWQGVLLGLATACFGVLTEIYLVRIGAFSYLPRAANFFGVPTWRPWLYFAASVTVGNWGRVLLRMKQSGTAR